MSFFDWLSPKKPDKFELFSSHSEAELLCRPTFVGSDFN